MAIVLLITISAVIFGVMITYRRHAEIEGPEIGIKRSYSTGYLMLIGFMLLAFLIAVYTRGI